MIKTAVIGASGYIGGFLFRKYRETFSDCIGTGFSRVKDGLMPFDLRNPDIKKLNLQETEHEAIVISSAMPLVGWCESHPKDSYELNVKGTLELVKQLADTSIHIIFLSSDYVFDGETGGYTDKSCTNPITEYGRQKAEVEREIPNLTNNYTIARLSKIYGTTWKDKTLIDDLAMSLVEGKTIKVAKDQFFSPTHVDDVVTMILFLQEQGIRGLVNVCHSNKYSRQQIATKLNTFLNAPPSLLQSVSLHDVPGMEKRPLDTSLICSPCLEGLQPSLWSIDDAIQQIAENWTQCRIAVNELS